MRVLIFHGYLLHGTGSNIYNANLAQALARLDHEVHLLCQDREAGSLPWVDAVGTWGQGGLEVTETGTEGEQDGDGRETTKYGTDLDHREGGGSVTAYVPEINGLLPVYVKDSYAGFEVKLFRELTDEELDAYLDANVAAVREVAARAGGVDAALANHLVMGPAILARAGVGFAVKIHGSALEYTVKPEPGRFLPFAREGVAAASGVLVGSRHTAESLWEAIDDPDVPAKTRLGPPGVDTDLFAPLKAGDARGALLALAADLRRERREGAGSEGSSWTRDAARASNGVEHLAAAAGPRIGFVGKLIVSKGVDLLLAAWPLVHAAHPDARLLVVGFGEYAETTERLWSAIERGDIAEVRGIAAQGRALEGASDGRPLALLTAFLDSLPEGYVEAAQGAAGSVAFSGRLEHEEVGRLVPALDAIVMPSTFPESFGMVAAEAAAAGVLPVSAAHSGLAEVSGELAAVLPPEAAGLVSFPLDEEAVIGIAGRVNLWLGLDEATREEARRALTGTVSRLWSWEGVARGVLAASAGELEGLPPVPSG